MLERIYDKSEIKNFTKDLKRLKFEGRPKERFAQVFYNEIPTQYIVSTYGRVISTRYRGVPGRVRVLKTELKSGYPSLTLVVNTKHVTCLVHRLVGIAFIKNPKNKREINHKDGIKTHPYVWNLEWATRKENDYHAEHTGLKKHRKGSEVNFATISDIKVRRICRDLELNRLTPGELCRKHGVSLSILKDIRKRKTWKHISKDYAVEKYSGGTDRGQLRNDESRIHRICELLEENKYSMTEIAKMTETGYGMIIKIRNGECHTKISKNYKISNYVPRTHNKSKKK